MVDEKKIERARQLCAEVANILDEVDFGHDIRHQTRDFAEGRPTADRGGEVECSHEPYHGRCVHCDVEFRNGQPIRSALATTAGEGWLDIKSAPKDGSRLWLVNQQMQEPVIGQWDDYRTPTGKVIKGWIVTHDPHERFQPLRYGTLITPTHWQPLPAALVTDKG